MERSEAGGAQREAENASRRALSSGDPGIQADAAATKIRLARYNALLAASPAERRALPGKRLAEVGEDAVIGPPFFCDCGFNIRLGANDFLILTA